MDSHVIADPYRKCLELLKIGDAERRPERARRLAFFDRVFQASSIKFFESTPSFGTYRELRSAFADGLYQTTVLLASCLRDGHGASVPER
jgi:hypothetical protein